MGNKIEKLLLKLEELCSMEINVPASTTLIYELKKMYPSLPQAVMDMYSVSNGIEINIPGTMFYPIEDILRMDRANYAMPYLKIGRMVFGDEIVIDKNTGKIFQMDHETGTEYLMWEMIEDFLNDELLALE